MHNIDKKVVEGFGNEWSRYDQSELSTEELSELFEAYFSIFPWHKLPKNAVGFDLGCGSGRWAYFVAPRVGTLHCIDPSAKALKVAENKLSTFKNCEFHLADAHHMPIVESSADFGYSVGVLHHIPDTKAALKTCATKLKPGAPLLLYLYYAFDNRPAWFRSIWRISDIIRRFIAKMPFRLKHAFSKILALLIYYPLARMSLLIERMGIPVDAFPLSYYRTRSFYVMNNDALDRFGTKLEQRFTRLQIKEMMNEAGLEHITFSETSPYWCVVGVKR